MKTKFILIISAVFLLFSLAGCSSKGITQLQKEIEAGTPAEPMGLVQVEEGYAAELVDGSIDPARIGRYDLTYRLTDLSDGSSKDVVFTFGVVDTTPPTIRIKQGIEVSMGSAFDPFEYLTVTDNADTVLPKECFSVEGNVDTSKKGMYELNLTVTDSSGNSASARMSVTVSDRSAVAFSEIELLFSSVDALRAKFGTYEKKVETFDSWTCTTYFFPAHKVEYAVYALPVASGETVDLVFYEEDASVFGIILGKTSFAEANTLLQNSGCELFELENPYTTEVGGKTLSNKGTYSLSFLSIPYYVDVLCDAKDVVCSIRVSYAF